MVENFHATDAVGVSILEQPVELAAIALELRALIEDLAENLLDNPDVLPNAQLAAAFLLNIGCRRQMVGMGMGFDQPLELVGRDPARTG